MKFTASVLALLSSVQLLSGQTYLFDKEGYLPPKGVVAEKKSIITMDEGKVKVTANGQIMNGTLKSNASKTELRAYLGDNLFLSLLSDSESTSAVVIGGREMPNNPEPAHLLKVKVLYEKVEGKWQTAAKNEKFTEAQQKEIDEELKKLNDSTTPYGFKARKVGETWDMEQAFFEKIIGGDNIDKAEGQITLQEIVELDGHKCAKLLCKIDVSGLKKGAMLSFKGDVTVWRSLEYYLDMKVEGKLATTVAPPAEKSKVEISGVTVIDESVSLKIAKTKIEAP